MSHFGILQRSGILGCAKRDIHILRVEMGAESQFLNIEGIARQSRGSLLRPGMSMPNSR